jgi:hypothetical protein
MKRIIGLSAVVLGMIMFVYAQDVNKSIEMTGWICNSKCVTHDQPIAACDASCKDKTGDVVLIDDKGKTTKISNPDMVKGHMGKKMKMKCHMNNSGEMEIEEVIRGSYGL